MGKVPRPNRRVTKPGLSELRVGEGPQIGGHYTDTTTEVFGTPVAGEIRYAKNLNKGPGASSDGDTLIRPLNLQELYGSEPTVNETTKTPKTELMPKRVWEPKSQFVTESQVRNSVDLSGLDNEEAPPKYAESEDVDLDITRVREVAQAERVETEGVEVNSTSAEVDPYIAEVNAAKDAQQSTLARRMEIRQLIQDKSVEATQSEKNSEIRALSTENLQLDLNELKDEENLLITTLNNADQVGNFDLQSEITANLQETREKMNKIRSELAYRKKEETILKLQSDVFEEYEAETLDQNIISRKSAEQASRLVEIQAKSNEQLEQDFDELGEEVDLLNEALSKAEIANDTKRQAEIIDELHGNALEMQAIYKEFTARNAKATELVEQQEQSIADRKKLKQELKANAEAILARKNRELDSKISEEKEAAKIERIGEVEYKSSAELEDDFTELEAEHDLLETALGKAAEAGDQKKQAEILTDIQNVALEMQAINQEFAVRNADVIKAREEARLLRTRQEARAKLQKSGEAILARIKTENAGEVELKRPEKIDFGGWDSQEKFNKSLELRTKILLLKQDRENIRKLRSKITEAQYKDEQLVLKNRLDEIQVEAEELLGEKIKKTT